jgi:dynactin 1
MVASEPKLGVTVEVTVGKDKLGRGVVRFIGPTSFASGRWVGVELAEPNGKNDGTVQGTRYFTCRMHHGVFCKATQVKIVVAEPEADRVCVD